jgi:hypothetical protein
MPRAIPPASAFTEWQAAMKWFTVNVYSHADEEGHELPDDVFAQAASAYKEHLASIEHRLSPEVRALAKVFMHDAVPKKVKSRSKSLALEFEVLEPPSGPRRPLELTYRRWDLGGGFGVQGVEILMEWGGDRFQVLNHEVDIAEDGRYIHRLLFWPAGELVVLFSELSIGP